MKKQNKVVRFAKGVKATIDVLNSAVSLPYRVRDTVQTIAMLPSTADEIRGDWADMTKVLRKPQSIILGENVFEENEIPPSAKDVFKQGVLLDFKKKYSRKEQPVLFGRQQEQREIKEAFLARRCPNALLVADAGFGKSTIAKHLMYQIATGNAGKTFSGANAYEFNYQNYKSNNIRLQHIAKAMSGKSYMFIDELHTLPMNLIEAMKDKLSEGDIKILATTTPKELERMLENSVSPDTVERRFRQINIKEAPPELVLQILKNNRANLQKDYGVALPEDMLDYLVELSADIKSDVYHSPAKEERLLDTATADARLGFEEKYNEIATVKKTVLNKGNIEYAVKKMAQTEVVPKTEGAPNSPKTKTFQGKEYVEISVDELFGSRSVDELFGSREN